MHAAPLRVLDRIDHTFHEINRVMTGGLERWSKYSASALHLRH